AHGWAALSREHRWPGDADDRPGPALGGRVDVRGAAAGAVAAARVHRGIPHRRLGHAVTRIQLGSLQYVELHGYREQQLPGQDRHGVQDGQEPRTQRLAGGDDPMRLTRRGFTLVELLVALVLLSVVTAALYRVLVNNQRLYQAQTQRIDLQQNIRAAANILPAEFRELDASDGDIQAMSATSINIRAMRWLG